MFFFFEVYLFPVWSGGEGGGKRTDYSFKNEGYGSDWPCRKIVQGTDGEPDLLHGEREDVCAEGEQAAGRAGEAEDGEAEGDGAAVCDGAEGVYVL